MLLRRLATLVGLGILAGAVLHTPLHAQDTTRTRRDTAVVIPVPPQADSLVRRDSIPGVVRAPHVIVDSVQPPMARAPLPLLVDAATLPLRWTRDSILATGAITMADLLERVPGLSTLRVTWLGLPAFAAYLGDVTRVRVFLDGLELDPAEPRSGATLDVTRIPIYLLDELRVERTASEVRIHARTWQVTRTTPESRVDVATGDQDTDVFRFFFGRRFGNGLGAQATVEQYSTTPDRVGATNSQLSLFARVGWARHAWQVDGVVLRQSPRRGVLFDDLGVDSIASLDLTRTEAYVRGGYGDVDGPAWAQVIAGAHGWEYNGIRDPRVDSILVDVDTITGDTTFTKIPADTSRFMGQFVLTGGSTIGLFRATATHRIRLVDGDVFHTPSARLSLQTGILDLSVVGEWRGVDSIARADAGVRITPTPFLRVGGSVGLRDDGRTGGQEGLDLRGEGSVRIGQLWIGGGVMSRAEALLPPPLLFDQALIPVIGPAARGAFATIQGTVWGPLQVDLLGEAWEDEGHPYRPRYTTRSDVYIRSNFLGRFPSGNFGLYALLRHDYRSTNYFPQADGLERVAGSRILTGLLEVRILDATLTYQFRNLLGTRFHLVPDYQMPRQTQYYGVRWTFWN